MHVMARVLRNSVLLAEEGYSVSHWLIHLSVEILISTTRVTVQCAGI